MPGIAIGIKIDNVNSTSTETHITADSTIVTADSTIITADNET